jgi:hypothetical protein
MAPASAADPVNARSRDLLGVWRGVTDLESQSPGCVGSIPAKRMAQLVLSYSLVGPFLAASLTRSCDASAAVTKPRNLHPFTPGAGRAVVHERAVESGCRVAARQLLA